FTGLQVGFVLVLAVIHETGDRRVRAGRDLDQVEICFLGETQGVLDPDLADLLAGGPDQEDLGDPDLTVDALFADVGSSPCVESEDDESPRMSCGGPRCMRHGADRTSLPARRAVGAGCRDDDPAAGARVRGGAGAVILTQRWFCESRRSLVRLATWWEGTPLEELMTRVSTCSSRLSWQERAGRPGDVRRARQLRAARSSGGDRPSRDRRGGPARGARAGGHRPARVRLRRGPAGARRCRRAAGRGSRLL